MDFVQIYLTKFKEINHKYETRYSKDAYKTPNAILDAKRFSIQYRGPRLWNNLLSQNLKTETSLHTFRRLLKNFLIDLKI